jgi:hypothetical protein
MTREEMINEIIRLAADLEDGETGTYKCITLACLELAEEAVETSYRQSALEAGIPLAVIEGKAKLTDYFSQEYIDSQAGRNKV